MENISSQLSPWASALFEFLPPFIRKQVCIVWYSSINSWTFITLIRSLILHCCFLMQLLLHPESDDSAQLSQVYYSICSNTFSHLRMLFLFHFIMSDYNLHMVTGADWNRKTFGPISWGWNEQAYGMLSAAFLVTVSWFWGITDVSVYMWSE